MPKESLKNRLDGNELDLSLSSLTLVPIKELLPLTRATHLDLSCNQLTVIPDEFCSLKHLVKLNLSKNQLSGLPLHFGTLHKLQHLDLFNNKIEKLPVSFCHLKSLKWLDVKDNPLDPHLQKVAGDCLDDLQCRKCAQKMVAFMKQVESEQERIKQKKLKEERELEAKRKDEEEREKQRLKAEKIVEKERRRKEYEMKKAELKQKELETERLQRQENEKVSANGVHDKQKPKENKRSGGFWCISFLSSVFITIIAISIGLVIYCQHNTENNLCRLSRNTIHVSKSHLHELYENFFEES